MASSMACASLLNTLLAAVPRMLLGMAENRQVFPIVKRTSRGKGQRAAESNSPHAGLRQASTDRADVRSSRLVAHQ